MSSKKAAPVVVASVIVLYCLYYVCGAQNLDEGVLDTVDEVLDAADLLLIVGTSSVVYPAAGYAPQVAQR